MADSRVLIGQFLSSRAKNPDTSSSPYSQGGIVGPGKSFLEDISDSRQQLKQIDRKLGEYVSSAGDGAFGKYSPLPSVGPGSQAWDPILYARSLVRLGSALGLGGVALFSAVQVGLFSLNVRGKVWNPALIDPPPILQNFLKPTLDLQFDLGLDTGQINLVEQNAPLEFLQGRSKSTRGAFQVEKTKLGAAIQSVVDHFKGADGPKVEKDPLFNWAFTDGVIPARMPADNNYGFQTFRDGGRPKIRDDEAYVPLSLTDLRPVGGVFRTVYFRPFDLSLREAFSPDWVKIPYFGRVDPVATYQSTTRTIDLSFRMLAFTPGDVKVIYQKLNWLASMVYPEYDRDLVYSSGPVVRLRVGDVISAGKGRGLPGIIDSVNLDYDNSLWELKKDFKVPREVTVTLSFTVLHDRPIGRGAEGKFGAIGTFDPNGLYVPPGRGGNSAGSDESKRYPQIQGVDDFRSVGGKDADHFFNGYETLIGADGDLTRHAFRGASGIGDFDALLPKGSV